MSTAETPITFDHIKKMLDDRDLEDRIEGWRKWYYLLRGGMAITREMLDELFKPGRHQLIGPGAESEWSSRVMQEIVYSMYAANEAIQVKLKRAVEAKFAEAVARPALLLPGSLGMSLFDDFHKTSWLAHLVDVRPRDERAVALVLNLLAKADFPLLERKEFCRGEFAVVLPRDGNLKAVLLVGRPGLFFADAAAAAAWEMRGARYAFPPSAAFDYEPKEWPDPDYHRVLESIAPGVPPLQHRTHFDAKTGVLTDYALVQKFEVLVNGHTVVVLRCAGCTFLGTYAAVQWATCDLLDQHRPGQPIPAPTLRGGQSKIWQRGLEVLIRVTAKLDPEKKRLPLMNIEVLDLRVDGLAWYQKKFVWETATPKHVVLFHRKGERPANDNITAVWLDGRRAQLKHDHDALRLFAALCRLAGRYGEKIPLAKLAQDGTIWADGEPRAVARVVTLLRLLNKRHVGRLIGIDPAKRICWLNADVRFAEDED